MAEEISDQAVTPQPQPAALEIIDSADPYKMPLGDLKKAAFSTEPQPVPPEQPQAQPPPAAPAEPQPYTVTESPDGVEIRLETGSTYKGRTWQDAVQALAKGKFEADRYIHQLKTWADEQHANPQQQPAPMPVDPARTRAGFSKAAISATAAPYE